MKRFLAAVMVVSVATCMYAQGPSGVSSVPAAAKKGKLARLYNEKFGGLIAQPGSRQGCVGFLNSQEKVPDTEIRKVVMNLKRLLNQEMRVSDVRVGGMPARADVEKAGVTVAVFVVDDSSLPALLAAPEERWSLVNVAKLGADLPEGAAGGVLLATRFRAELMRAFSLVAGGATSQYPNNVHIATELRQLDSMDADALTMDVIQRCQNHLFKNLKVKPERITTYKQACVEGWAPPPTNDVQKAIWDKVHELPAAPMKIKPETKKVRD